MTEEKLTIKEKAVKYDNWVKYVDGRGWSEILQKPLKVKIVIDKLKKEIKDLKQQVESHKGTGIMLSRDNQILKRQKIVLQDELKVVQAKYEAVKKYNKTMTEGLQEELLKNASLKEENDSLGSELQEAWHLVQAHKHKVEMINQMLQEWITGNDVDFYPAIAQLKEILEEK